MTRRYRLSRSRDFDAVYRSGRSVSTRYLTLYSFRRPDEDADVSASPRLGLAVSRQIGGAVARNRIKRQLRVAFEKLGPDLPRTRDYVLIVRPGLAETAESKGFDWLSERVAEVFGLAVGTERTQIATTRATRLPSLHPQRGHPPGPPPSA